MRPLQSPCLTSLLKQRRLIISSKHVSLDFTVVTKPLSLGAYGLRIFNTPLPCLLYTSPSPRDGLLSRMPSSA